MLFLCPTHTHTQLTPHTHTHSPTHTHSHTLSALSHTCLALPLLLSLSLCPVTPVLLSCPVQPSPALPRPASPCPARHEVHARALSACPSGRTTAHGSPYRTLPDTTTWHTWHTWHTTRHYSKLLETTTYYHLSHSLSLLSPATGTRPPTDDAHLLSHLATLPRATPSLRYPRASRFLHRPTLRSLTPPLQPMCWATSR